MFESVGVLVVFFFLIIIGASFWAGTNRVTFLRETARLNELLATQIAQRAMFMPELDCRFAGSQQDACFDKGKAIAFSELALTPSAHILYFQSFGTSTITLHEIYPRSFTTVLYNHTIQTTGINVFQTPVLLQNNSPSDYSFGILEVKVYESP